MKKNPLETRVMLANRFPRWTQPFWTWLTGVAMPGERPLYPWTYGTHLGALLLVWIANLVLGTWAVAGLLEPALGAA